jgi:transcriptional regulator with XRE-family HTH domain
MTTGRSLRSARRRKDLRQLDLAHVLDRSRSRVSQIEAMQRVPRPLAERYRGALAKLSRGSG